MTIRIECYPRLHLSLFSMHNTGVRVNGGIGFAIKSPSLMVDVESSSTAISINDRRQRGLTESAHNELLDVLNEIRESRSLERGVSITISGANANSGFGSGTSLRLSSIEAILKVNSVEYNCDELVSLSKRGGTSGIGINTYFTGGLVVDLGVKNTNTMHVPSSVVEDVERPLLLAQYEMPDWPIGICIPNLIGSLTKKQEIEFFARTCPISSRGAYESLYHSVVGVTASVCEIDKKRFEYSIKALQNCEWKMAERQVYGKELVDIEERLYKIGATAVGMSSLGPSLYFLSDDMGDMFVKARDVLPDCTLHLTFPCNKGRTIHA